MGGGKKCFLYKFAQFVGLKYFIKRVNKHITSSLSVLIENL